MNRSNLHTFTNTTALDINLGGERNRHSHRGDVAAKGVNVVLSSGATQLLRSKREVNLSADTYRTPGLLERSGIGNPSILRNLSITPKVVLPGVGTHLQDQWLVNLIYTTNFPLAELAVNFGRAPITASLTAADLFGDEVDTVAAQLRSDIPSYARILSDASGGAISVQAQEQILRLRADLIFEKSAAIGAMMIQNYGANSWPTMPFSTGTVHVSFTPLPNNPAPSHFLLHTRS